MAHRVLKEFGPEKESIEDFRDKVEEALRTQVEAGELIPVERSEWAAPIVVVQKMTVECTYAGTSK